MAQGLRKIPWAQTLRTGLVLLLLILALAASFRLYGLDWDEGQLFHPDERKIIIVLEEMGSVNLSHWRDWFSLQSPLNPHFFSYGSFPIYLLKGLLALLARGWQRGYDYRSMALVGRSLSVAFDLGTVALSFLVGRKLYGLLGGLAASLMIVFSVLHIQLAHFYTVDTLLAFFILCTLALTFPLCHSGRYRWGILAGACYGLALATKFSAFPLGLILLLAWALWAGQGDDIADDPAKPRADRKARVGHGIRGLGLTLSMAVLVLLLAEPYALLDWRQFVDDLLRESAMVRGTSDVEYTRQYVGTPAYIYQIVQAFRFSPGPFISLAGLGGSLLVIFYGICRRLKREEWLLLTWIGLYLAITGHFQVKYIRYMLPIWAPISLLAIGGWLRLADKLRTHPVGRGFLAGTAAIVLAGAVIWALAFLNIYRERHTWLRASAWIYANIPAGASIRAETWDHPLPVGMEADGRWMERERYNWDRLELYEYDTPGKLEYLAEELAQADYLILASNRMYGVLPRLESHYPLSSRYYRLLFAGDLGYKLVDQEASYPRIGPLTLVDDTFSEGKLPVPKAMAEYHPSSLVLNLGKADESFTVYDHPKALIFQKVESLTQQELGDRLRPPSWAREQ